MQLQLSDQTFIPADRSMVAAVVCDPLRWRAWWPDLQLQLSRDRGLKGCQWLLTGTTAGTAEIYLEPWHDGTVLHLFLRLELPDPAARSSRGTSKRLKREARARTLSWKSTINQVRDELAPGRAPGTRSSRSAQAR